MPGSAQAVSSEAPAVASVAAPRTGTDAFAALPPRQRVLLAAMECVGRWGMAKTTMDDVARAAGCGRATVYRLFPDGKPELFRMAAQATIGRTLNTLARQLESAETLEELVYSGVYGAARLSAENPAFQYLVEHEPHRAAPHLSFKRLELLLAMARGLLGPSLRRFVDPVTADRIVELGARVVVAYVFLPAPGFDLADPAVAARIVDRYVLTPLAPSVVGSLRSIPITSPKPKECP